MRRPLVSLVLMATIIHGRGALHDLILHRVVHELLLLWHLVPSLGRDLGEMPRMLW